MSEAFAGKSNAQIIDEQSADLDQKSRGQTGESFNPRNTALSEESGLNESGVNDSSKFPGVEIQHGRGGMTGGGDEVPIRPGEGADGDQIESSRRYEGIGGPEDKRAQELADNPGGYDARPRGIDEVPDRSKAEVVPMTEGQQLEDDQEGTARGFSINS
ncbi:hypothetical protein BDZ90DRAFT_232902 [Jaminaea rosea]|uniref:Uncharacterized protein n=1 Tax=Jaminaea rosea TaxID=1569628 RepID=A0A316UNG6_9BASI|nr:hypothetical protein BDZ90DRAFT_232902 [Jaminaea rosea]PWN26800.1 hypothetical protein BDZ90DRAFT_232902 [Jaminaea rosea]